MEKKFCPVTKGCCKGSLCAWWVLDETKSGTRNGKYLVVPAHCGMITPQPTVIDPYGDDYDD